MVDSVSQFDSRAGWNSRAPRGIGANCESSTCYVNSIARGVRNTNFQSVFNFSTILRDCTQRLPFCNGNEYSEGSTKGWLAKSTSKAAEISLPIKLARTRASYSFSPSRSCRLSQTWAKAKQSPNAVRSPHVQPPRSDQGGTGDFGREDARHGWELSLSKNRWLLLYSLYYFPSDEALLITMLEIQHIINLFQHPRKLERVSLHCLYMIDYMNNVE